MSWKKIVFPILVLAVGAGTAFAIVASRKPPEKIERPQLGPLVKIETARTESLTLEVTGQGEVSPRVSVALAPQVTGRVVEVHPSLVTGGRFRAGTVLVRVDPRDYELAVERARASVASAETALARELAEADAAIAEWRDVHGDAEPPPLLVREPQIREGRARQAAAEADLAAAELQLERTELSLPFDGLVVNESVDPGQLVSAGQQVAMVYGTDRVEIRVPLDDRELAYFNVNEKPAAEVYADFAGQRQTWAGRVDRLEGTVDSRSRMVRVVVTVDKPFSTGNGQRPPLLPGTFVDVSIAGNQVNEAVVIPRYALRRSVDGVDQVWVVEKSENQESLIIRDVEVLRRERDRVVLGAGVVAGERVVTSSIDVVTSGMKVRTPEDANRG